MDSEQILREALAYLTDLGKFGMVLTLDRIQALLAALHQPQEAFPIIHVAGTNGKGSTARLIAAALQAAGLRTGLFTSPHLVRYNERIMIDGEPITDHALLELLNLVKPLVPNIAEACGHPTEFEICTAMTFLHFAREQVDVAVVEVGMGGTWDTTNVVNPLLSIITPVSMDHMSRLGQTLPEIAAQKAGIIKHSVPVVVAPQHPEAAAVIAQAAAAAQAPIYWVTDNTTVVNESGQVVKYTPLQWNADGGQLDVHGPREEWSGINIALLGSHQLMNAAVAAASCQLLAELGLPLGEGDVRTAFAGTTWPGRLEVVERNPVVLLDGAHNVAGAETLHQALHDLFPTFKKVLVVGMLAEKQVEEVLVELLSEADVLVCTAPASGRTAPLPPTELERLARTVAGRLDKQLEIVSQAGAWNAIQLAKTYAGHDGLVCVCGSLYMLGEVREAWA